ncbi:sugar ABC transporter permease [Catenulispora yoronensis]|uniref:Sugar ABC transporter permease n=1 Tax=Catenulispora yoronensis TaxID=450799 RepID=A0ABN2U3Z1_9ACTN
MARPASPAAVEDPAGLGRARAAAIAAPALLVVLAFLVFPALWTLYLGTTNYRLTGFAARHPRSVGIDNYKNVVQDPAFHHSLWLTFEYVLGSAVIGQALLGFTIAWLLRDASGRLKRLVEALVLLAWILPSSVVAFLWSGLLDRDSGTVNTLLHTQGTAWIVEHPMAVIIVFNIWRGTAFSMLLYSAALTGVPPSQLATARMFGANQWQQLRDVVFPHIRGHVLTNLLLISLWTFNDFTPYQITGGADARSQILPVYIYQTALFDGQMGLGAAIALLMLVINLVVALVYLRLLRERRLERAA